MVILRLSLYDEKLIRMTYVTVIKVHKNKVFDVHYFTYHMYSPGCS